MKNIGEKIVKYRVMITLISLILLIPSAIGFFNTRINYDMLSYLPKDIATIQGQDILMDEFGKGAFTCVVTENMDSNEVQELVKKIEGVEHVEKVLSYDSITKGDIPVQILPKDVTEKFINDQSEMIVVFLNTSTSAEETLDAISNIRKLDDRMYVSGASAMVNDLKNLCEKEVPIYVILAVVLSLIAMILTLDNWIIPIVFMISIGVSIVFNMGTNLLLGQISFITMCLAAVLQLAVTLDYSIFLWHSYEEQKETNPDNLDAMAKAINKTFISIVGSSTTTIAGFIALCFMTYTLGMDLGIVMTKGVILGVIGCCTILPSYILLMDSFIQKFNHKCLLPPFNNMVQRIIKHYKPIIAIFILLTIPAVIGRQNVNVYYDLSSKLSVDAGLDPKDVPYSVANNKLSEQFGVGNMSILIYDAKLDEENVQTMIHDMEKVDGIDYVLGEDSLDMSIPKSWIPKEIRSELESDQHKILIINSEYKNGSDICNAQIDQLNKVIEAHDPSAYLIGEACMSHDLIKITDVDFQIVNTISIVAIFIIILLVTKSISLPIILVCVIEFAIFLNLGTSYYLKSTMAFIAPICISTIQLGACVDYGILMTNRYKQERLNGNKKEKAIEIAMNTSIPSIIVSALGLFAATIGVTIYSNIDIISGICTLMARGAIISMASVILLLPSLLLMFDSLITKTTLDMRKKL
ncbi:MAG: MMPL family transporter [Firmicutes bacterium]|nr:MMPL family transporter [Bacillota bacterium]